MKKVLFVALLLGLSLTVLAASAFATHWLLKRTTV